MRPDERVVDIVNDEYRPAHTRVLVGGTVTWISHDNGFHTAETDGSYTFNGPDSERVDFDTHSLTWGEPYTVTFHKPGTYEYFCSLDRDMKGTVEVVTRRPPP